jgi:hypothetical protein
MTKKKTYHQLYCGIIDTLKGQLTNQYSEIYRLKCVSFLGFGNFKATLKGFHLLFMSHYWNCTDGILILFYWKLNFLLFICWRNFYIAQIFDHIRSEYSITRSHKIVFLQLTISPTSACHSLLWRGSIVTYTGCRFRRDSLSYL